MRRTSITAVLFLSVGEFLVAAPPEGAPAQSSIAPEKSAEIDVVQVVEIAVQRLLAMQEGDEKAEWPYEGVYRVGGEIPVGYRIGGTGICAMALLQAPGYEQDQARKDAIARAVKFIVQSAEHPLMNPDYEGGYDVRGWGYTYGLMCLLQLKSNEALPADLKDGAEQVIRRYIDAIAKTEINKVGGWNYARGRGRDAVSPPSPFMTAPTLQVLFQAKSMGYEVNDEVVGRALEALEQARTPTGSYRYSGVSGDKSREAVPGSIGRMLASETTLHLAGRSSVANVRGAVDAFLVHWQWLEKRRSQQGTHAPPYGIAPYYFFYAHYYAAQAIEMLPQHERGEYRRRLRELLMSVRAADGSWNDRVFDRTANYGTAMSIMAMLMPQTPAPVKWPGSEVAKGE